MSGSWSSGLFLVLHVLDSCDYSDYFLYSHHLSGFFSVTFAMSGSSGLLLVVHVLDSWDYSLAASVFHGSLTLSAPRSTYKFSWLASIHFLEKLLERICLQIKAFFFSDHSINSLNLSARLCIDFLGEKIDFGHTWDLRG